MRTGSDVARERGGDGVSADVAGGLILERVQDREAADRWRQLVLECFAADYYEMPADTAEEVYERVESHRADERYELWIGSVSTHAGGAPTPVVAGDLGLPMLDNVDNAVVSVRTAPSFRRHGYGTQMLRHLTERARSHGRTRLIGEVGEPMLPDDAACMVPGALFALNIGARPVTSEVRRLLRIRDIDDADLTRLKDDAIAHSTSYSLIQWNGPVPAEFLDDIVVLMSRMTIDAPLEELDWEPEQWTPERYREREQRVVANGQVCLTTAARHNESGRVVAVTEIGVATAQPDVAYQWSTIVLPSDRGHRLGLLVKLGNLEFMRASRPSVQMINTWNAAVNDHMVSINEAIGFRAVERWREWQLELSDATT